MKLSFLFAALVCVGLIGCVSPEKLIEAASKDPAKARFEFSGWNTHFVYERDNSFSVLTNHVRITE